MLVDFFYEIIFDLFSCTWRILHLSHNIIPAENVVEVTKQRVTEFEMCDNAIEAIKLFGQLTTDPKMPERPITAKEFTLMKEYLMSKIAIVSKAFLLLCISLLMIY